MGLYPTSFNTQQPWGLPYGNTGYSAPQSYADPYAQSYGTPSGYPAYNYGMAPDQSGLMQAQLTNPYGLMPNSAYVPTPDPYGAETLPPIALGNPQVPGTMPGQTLNVNSMLANPNGALGTRPGTGMPRRPGNPLSIILQLGLPIVLFALTLKIFNSHLYDMVFGKALRAIGGIFRHTPPAVNEVK